MINLGQDSWYPSQDLNSASSEYKSRALLCVSLLSFHVWNASFPNWWNGLKRSTFYTVEFLHTHIYIWTLRHFLRLITILFCISRTHKFLLGSNILNAVCMHSYHCDMMRMRKLKFGELFNIWCNFIMIMSSVEWDIRSHLFLFLRPRYFIERWVLFCILWIFYYWSREYLMCM
jgi:hypothetical protein